MRKPQQNVKTMEKLFASPTSDYTLLTQSHPMPDALDNTMPQGMNIPYPQI